MPKSSPNIEGIYQKPRLDLLQEQLEPGIAHWSQAAQCMGHEVNIFYPERGQGPNTAKQMCSTCVARLACLEYALEAEERFGIWGGLTPRGRLRYQARQ